MRRCVKCSLIYTDSSKICRSCGAILEELEGQSPLPAAIRGDQREQLELIAEQALSTVGEEPKDRSRDQYGWTCSRCGEGVPGSFDLCWNCGTDRNGVTAPPDFEVWEKVERLEVPPPNSAKIAKLAVERRCTLCGTTKIVPNVEVVDQGKHSSGSLQLVVYGDPDALIFKDRRWGEIMADICGECGHVQLRVRNCKELYDHYMNSRGEANG